jgi:hypothetical protein
MPYSPASAPVNKFHPASAVLNFQAAHWIIVSVATTSLGCDVAATT